MWFLQIHVIIMKLHIFFRNLYKNNENHEIHRNQNENRENIENNRNPYQNLEKHANTKKKTIRDS